MRDEKKIAVVIPCYNVERHINGVVLSLPAYIDRIFLVDDCSTDGTAAVLASLAAADGRVAVLRNDSNMGVGGAMLRGFAASLQESLDVVVKLDGDGQMDVSFIAALLDKMDEETDYVKGNRLYDRKALMRMPWLRRIGNMGLGFMLKAASGYWNLSDPVNGFFAVRVATLRRIDFSRIANRYFFESSLLIELFYVGAHIREVSMPAIYADEESHLSVAKTLFQFPPKLLRAWLRRIRLQYFVYDFNVCSLYIIAGLPCFLFGLLFGLTNWISNAIHAIPTPTGTIMVALLTFVMGFQMLLSAVQFDISTPNPFEKHRA